LKRWTNSDEVFWAETPEINVNGQVQNVCFAKVCSADGGFRNGLF
jgi:hypothetical protein